MGRISRLINGYDVFEAHKPISHIVRNDPNILDQFMCGDKVEKTSVYVYPDRVEIYRQRMYDESQGGEIDSFRFDEISSVILTHYLDTKYIRFNFKPSSTYYFSQEQISAPRINDHYSFPNEVIYGSEDALSQHIAIIQRAISDYKRKPMIQTFINNGTYFNITSELNQIQQEIYEKGGSDAKELSELLEEVRKLIKILEDTGKVDKNSNTWKKILDCADQHGWAFGAFLSTIGQAAVNAWMLR